MRVTVITMPELGWDCVVDVVEGTEEDAKQGVIEEAKIGFDYEKSKGWRKLGQELDEGEVLEQYWFL